MTAADTVLNGRYRLERLLGRGGFARVYLAADLRLRRQVAVKVLDSEHLDADGAADFRARFEREAQAVAALDHPNILAVHDYGETAEAVYLVMPYVSGGTLAERLRRSGRFSPAETLGYLHQIAAALDYAHALGIVHRDLKPQNLLLTGAGDRLLLADFGIAKLIRESSSTSGQSAAVGTIAYMAPEQFRGRVTTATDIYALGCLLFQCLTGTIPYGGATEEVMYGHFEAPVPTLADRGVSLPPALDVVLARALAKRPEERYTSVSELAGAFANAAAKGGAAAQPPPGPSGDAAQPLLQRTIVAVPAALPVIPTAQLTGDPVASPTPTPAPRLSSLLLVGVSALAIVLILVAAILLTQQGGAEIAPTAPLKTAVAVVTGTPSSLPTATRPVSPSATIPTVTATIRRASTAQTFRQESVAVLASALGAAWSPDGAILATADTDNSVRLWTASGQPIATLTGHTKYVSEVAWSPDGKILASAGADTTVRLWSADGKPLATLAGHTDNVATLAWSPDGRTLASGSWDMTVRLWSADGAAIATLAGSADMVTQVAWSPDGQVLATICGFSTGSKDRAIRLWSRTGKVLATMEGHTATIWEIAWSPDGRILASGADDGTARMWDSQGKLLAELRDGNVGSFAGLAWSPDGKVLATGSADGFVRYWSPDGKLLSKVNGNSGVVYALAWSPDGTALAGAAVGGKLLLWDASGKQIGIVVANGKDFGEALSWSPSGAALVVNNQLWR